MAFQALVANLTQKAIDILGDLKGTGIYTSVGQSVYNAETDQTESQDKVFTGIPMVQCSLTVNELEASPLKNVDCKLLIAANDLPVTPNENDRIQAFGRLWMVVNIKSPPSNPLWILLVRQA